MGQLERASLSFAVPAPIPLAAGRTLLPIPNSHPPAYAALFPLIPGQHPDVHNAAHMRACGAALAELDLALAHIDIPLPPATRAPSSDLAQVHSSVPDPIEMVRDLPVESPVRSVIVALLTDVQAKIPFLYKSLPQQLIHRDFDVSNVLVEGDRVTGVLDFEFAGFDLRAFELVPGLTPFMNALWNVEQQEPAASFVRGYRERLSLTPAEIEALPDLILLYRMVSLIHREGRRRQGVASRGDVIARAMALVRLQTWLRKHRVSDCFE